MTEPLDILQERLARLEAGEPLESVLAGLPADEAGLVKMAVSLRTVPQPARSPEVVAAQRQKLLRVAQKDKAMSQDKRSVRSPVWLIGLAASAAALFICVMIASAIAGIAWLRSGAQPPVAAQNPSPESPWSFIFQPREVSLEPTTPQAGVLRDVKGVVEVQAADGAWKAAANGDALTAGNRIRTRALSSATLTFYDGSRLRLGPETEISIDALDAQKAGPRVILLTQSLGESDHEVAASSDPGARYEVATPSGVGAAKGTKFRVFVSSTLLVRFDVDEGQVAVTNLSVTVLVIPGQSTVIVVGQPPTEPAFRLSGEGEVTEIGRIWRIAGETLFTNSDTVIVGDPQVGDWAAFEARRLPDGSRFADRIVFLRPTIKNKFTFIGIVDAIGDSWTIAGRTVRVDALTGIDDGIALGDRVEVEGGLAADGTLWASRIVLIILTDAGLPFQFTGVVESIGESAWTVSGVDIAIDEDTQIEADIAVGDVVQAKGVILDDDAWLATSIRLVEEARDTFEFTGKVESDDPWQVAGIGFETDELTDIDEGIEVGDRVKVKGRILANGTWIAAEIELLDEELRFEFVGEVSSLDPWIIGGVTLAADENTEVIGDIAIGDTARVEGRILEDGAWLAEEIKLLALNLGCIDNVAVVRLVENNRIILLDWQAIELDQAVAVTGDIEVASVVIVRFCIAEDQTVIVISIIVVFQLDELPVIIIPPGNDDDDGSGGDGQVTICHRPSGDSDKARTLTVGPGAVQGHLAHGDTLGPCGGDRDGDDDD